jgi:ribosomal protein S18 acetylase RimI-like enzyme
MPVSIRPATVEDASAIARVRVDSWRATYRGIVPDAYLDSMDVESSAQLWDRVLAAGSSSASVFVAEDDGRIVGFAAGNLLKEPRHELNAELTAIYLRPDYQHAGLGRRLVASVARAERAHGANGLIAWVMSGNKRARAFYERLGGTLLIEQPFEWDGVPLVEAGYGFHDLDSLIEACVRDGEAPQSTVH